MEPGVSAIVRCPHSWAHDTSICHHRQQWCTGAAPRPLATTSWSFGYPTIRYPGSRGKKCSECGVNICLIAPRGPVVQWSPSTIVTMSHQSSDQPRPAQASTVHSGVSSPRLQMGLCILSYLFCSFLYISHLFLVFRIFLLFFPILIRKYAQAELLLGTWSQPITASIYIY